MEHTPLRAIGNTPKIVSRAGLGHDNLSIIAEEIKEETGKVKKTLDFKVDFVPLNSFRTLNLRGDSKSERSRRSGSRRDVVRQKEKGDSQRGYLQIQQTVPDRKESWDIGDVSTADVRRLRTFAEELDRK